MDCVSLESRYSYSGKTTCIRIIAHAPVSFSILIQFLMYCVCKFSGTWSVYDGTTKKRKLLEETAVAIINVVFVAALLEDAILDLIMVKPVSASKLHRLSKPAPPAS